ncbi:MAG TPA: glycosyltransferase family 2 protein [Methanolinea sp.]|nr:glycosyltransferase family 2 protein [Methanolinea sp.]HQK55181.1 glycosyltransferase family 2 protein [Methanolinea sp.]
MTGAGPEVSVIIVNYNGERFLKTCLDSLRAQSFTDFEVYLVDNHSSDRSIEIVEKLYPEVALIRESTNLGFAHGTNEGIRASRGQFILTLNNDTRLDPGFLEKIVLAMKREEKAGICASKMLYPDGRINSVGICISRSGAAWDRGIHEPDHGQYDHPEEVFGACAGAALYRRAMLDEIGLFDEDFFMYMEDVDLAFRALLAGWKCMYVPGAVAYHHHGGTAGVGSDTAVYFGNRNIIWIAVKNFPASILLSSLPWIIGRNIGVIAYYALKGQLRVILRSKIDAFSGLNLSLQKRKTIVHKVPDHEVSSWVHTWYSPGRG